MKWVAVTVVSLVVAGFGVLGYHRTLPSCLQVAGYETTYPNRGAGSWASAADRDLKLTTPIYDRTGSGFFNCR